MSRKSSGTPQSGEDPADEDLSTSAVLSLLKSLRKYTKDKWTSREEALWKKGLEMWREEELEALRSRGLDDQKAEKLVERVWVSRDPKSSDLLVAHLPPKNLSSFVPAIRVFRDGSFVIHPRVLDYLDCHPVLAVPGGDESAADNDRPLILQALDAIEGNLGLGYIGLGYVAPAVPEDGGVDRRIVDCASAAHQLYVLLDTECREAEPGDDLEWLRVARESDRFWRLLDTAFLLGGFMERYQLLDQQGAEDAMLRKIAVPPGKGDRINKCIVRMIEAYALEHNLEPTPEKLVIWMGGEIPLERGKPLLIDHPLWTVDMKPISWERFQDLVKKVKRKMKQKVKRTGNADP